MAQMEHEFVWVRTFGSLY